MGRKKRARTSKLGPEKEPRLWRPTNRQVLWAIGLVVALVTITLLVDSLYPAIWQALSRERVAMLIGFGVTLVVIIVLLAIGGTSLGWTGSSMSERVSVVTVSPDSGKSKRYFVSVPSRKFTSLPFQSCI